VTREEWLNAAVVLFRPVFEKAGHPLPERIRASVAWPSAGGLRRVPTVGEHWHSSASRDGTHELFVSPRLEKPMDILATLAHELAHSALPEGTGHRGKFPVLVRQLGLAGKPTSTHPSTTFKALVAPWIASLGPFPHAKLTATAPHTKQITRLIKVKCPGHGYVARVSGKWLSYGAPICPMCHQYMVRGI